MKSGIVYLLTGMPSAARLVVSIYTLRQWYSGPITVFTTRDESHEIGGLLASEKRLTVNTLPLIERVAQGYNSTYITKPKAALASPYEETVFLDADTIVAGDISDLLFAARTKLFTATVFCDLTTGNPEIAERIQMWSTLEGEIANQLKIQELARRALTVRLPAVNTGIFAFNKHTPLMPIWDQLACAGAHLPLPDEVSMQLLLLTHEHQILGSRFNCHPFAYGLIPDVRIWHFAGGIHLESPYAKDMWLPIYRECWDKNLANMQSWSKIEDTIEAASVADE